MNRRFHFLVGSCSAATHGMMAVCAGRLDAWWLAIVFGIFAAGNVIVAWEGARE